VSAPSRLMSRAPFSTRTSASPPQLREHDLSDELPCSRRASIPSAAPRAPSSRRAMSRELRADRCMRQKSAPSEAGPPSLIEPLSARRYERSGVRLIFPCRASFSGRSRMHARVEIASRLRVGCPLLSHQALIFPVGGSNPERQSPLPPPISAAASPRVVRLSRLS